MLCERFIDGVLGTHLKREMRRFAMDKPDIGFQEFRTIVLRWCEDERKVDMTSVSPGVQDVQVDASAVQEKKSEMMKLLRLNKNCWLNSKSK